MKKRIAAALILVLIITSFTACGGTNDGGGTAGDVVTIKVGHVCAESHPCQTAFLNFADRVAERSGGSMKVEVYPASQLGSEREMIEMTLNGGMEIFYSGSQTLGLFCDAVNFQGLPFFFTGGKPAARDFFEIYGDEIAQKFSDELGVTIIWTDNSAYGQGTTKKQVVLPEDIKGLKIRTLETEMMIKTYEVLGALASPVATSEVYTALQQGTIDATTSNMILMGMMNWNEVCDYYTDTKMFVDMGVTMMSNAWLDTLTEEQRTILMEELEAFRDEYSELFTEAETDLADELNENGTQVIKLTEDQYNQWIQAVQPVYDWFRTTYGDTCPKFDEYLEAAQEINAKYVK